MVVAVVVISCLVSSWIISHLGRKPVSGGRPASDRRVIMRVVFSMGVLVHEDSSVDSLRVLVVFRMRKIEVVIRVYM